MTTPEKFIVCCALPYANGPLHIGHLAGCYLPGDVYVRYRRMQGYDVHFLCGSDEYGVAITIRARQENTTPRAIVDKYNQLMKETFERCNINFDVYSRTTNPCHTARSQDFFLNLDKANLIEKKSEFRLFCEKDQQFLPDRYVVGDCPVCKSPGARGDQCEKCGSWYEPEALLNPICQICKVTKASLRETTHWYLRLDKLEDRLKAWLETKTSWRKAVLGYAYQPIKSELAPRAITRDIDWGIPVPLPDAEGKVLYVWFDAPIGYISASEDWSIRQGKPDRWKDYWADPKTKLIHFIGKDNIVFHTIVWPAILMGDNRYVLPELVCGNEFLNLEGEKISTSRNHAIWLHEVLNEVETDLLRFYITRISPETSDSNFTWEDYQSRINSELADVIGNLVNRTLSFLKKNYGDKIAWKSLDATSPVGETIQSCYTKYTQQMDGGLTKGASDALLELARFFNGHLQNTAPWKVFKEDKDQALQILSEVACGIKAVVVLLSPICPDISQKIWDQLGLSGGVADLKIEEVFHPLPSTSILGEIQPIVQKVEDTFVEEQRAKLLSPKN